MNFGGTLSQMIARTFSVWLSHVFSTFSSFPSIHTHILSPSLSFPPSLWPCLSCFLCRDSQGHSMPGALLLFGSLKRMPFLPCPFIGTYPMPLWSLLLHPPFPACWITPAPLHVCMALPCTASFAHSILLFVGHGGCFLCEFASFLKTVCLNRS